MAMWRRGYRSCAAVRALTAPPGRRCGCPIISPSWPGRVRSQGKLKEAVALLDDALQIVERTGERWFAAELNRHKGQLLLRQGHSEAAEELYRKALSIARGAGGQALGIARRRRASPGSPRPGPPRRSPRPSRPGLRLVHRGLRHARSQGRKGAARRAELELRRAQLAHANLWARNHKV